MEDKNNMQRRIELNIKSDHLGRILKDLGIIETPRACIPDAEFERLNEGMA